MENCINKSTKNNITRYLVAVAFIGIMTSLVLFSAISEVTARPIANGTLMLVKPIAPAITEKQNTNTNSPIKGIPVIAQSAVPASLKIFVKPALKKISLKQNTVQEVITTITNTLNTPQSNIDLAITVISPSGSIVQYSDVTDPDGTDHLLVGHSMAPLHEKGKYKADVIATNPLGGPNCTWIYNVESHSISMIY